MKFEYCDIRYTFRILCKIFDSITNWPEPANDNKKGRYLIIDEASEMTPEMWEI